MNGFRFSCQQTENVKRKVSNRMLDFCCSTASMEQAANGAETAAIDRLVSWWSEKISVWLCLRAPGYGLTLSCALGLLVGGGGQIKVTQLQLQLQNVTRQNMTKQTAFQDVQRHTSGVSIPLLQRSSDDQMDYLTKPSPAGFQTSVKMWQSSQVNKSRKIVLLQFMHMIMYNFINYETTCNSQ